ncbi:hypothetical protein [Szabonella alba]|uniref:Uncharacterized protein n=1 Tax=Szabonella alba TaxID=2804194 RepID=A0A8K0VDY0_9RHOB|nr:hypothetical protein [Szabonella alba]MBL4917924.1 hypothetical protein [Szabonella alba]
MVVALTAVTGLSACLGSGSGGGGAGGGGGGGGGGGSYQSNFDAVSGQGPTQNMPTSLNADYSGQMEVDVNDGTQSGTAYADLDIAVNWTEGQSSNPFSGTASNFTGELASGQAGDITGTLEVVDAPVGTINRSTFAVPAPGSGTVSVGGGQFTMRGDLAVDGTEYDTTLLLGGNFFGSGASAMQGAVSGGVKEKGIGGALFDAAAGGTFYLIQD